MLISPTLFGIYSHAERSEESAFQGVRLLNERFFTSFIMTFLIFVAAPFYGVISLRLRAWLRRSPENFICGRGLSERSEFRSPDLRDCGTGTRRATPGRQWFWVLLPKQKDLVARGRNPAARPALKQWLIPS